MTVFVYSVPPYDWEDEDDECDEECMAEAEAEAAMEEAAGARSLRGRALPPRIISHFSPLCVPGALKPSVS